MADSGGSMPKTIWFVWFQGLRNAPYVVRKCHESWVVKNPGWRVATLDETALSSVASVNYSAGNIAGLSPQHQADLLRLDLLSHHGGVWADATCFCVQPLEDWLPQNLGSGFFAFHRPRPNRIISNWFLAAEPGNALVSRMFERMLAYWGDHAFRNAQRHGQRADPVAARVSANPRLVVFPRCDRPAPRFSLFRLHVHVRAASQRRSRVCPHLGRHPKGQRGSTAPAVPGGPVVPRLG
jgi:hypothetical protein